MHPHTVVVVVVVVATNFHNKFTLERKLPSYNRMILLVKAESMTLLCKLILFFLPPCLFLLSLVLVVVLHDDENDPVQEGKKLNVRDVQYLVLPNSLSSDHYYEKAIVSVVGRRGGESLGKVNWIYLNNSTNTYYLVLYLSFVTRGGSVGK